ncbi:MAG TPA: MOSC domain-containing protein [Candidatus Sulfotelmatobacter sp.]|jgi:MOSC domain-containing protein YiiM|nr:MOSC domain-containing protein [Candidatus Sulfotelmatobacter sp.]
MPATAQESKLLSLNVARPRLTVYKGTTIDTGIFKVPVKGTVRLRTLNLDGDRQADLSVHGGPYKAVYAYPSEHYEYWRRELPGTDLPWGAFGENFTTIGLFEDDLHVGDRLKIGSAEVMVRQMRMPCYKLAAKFQRDDMIERFLHSGRSGFYFSVEREGDVSADNAFEAVCHGADGITISEMNMLVARDRYNHELIQKALATPALPDDWKEYFGKRLIPPSGHSPG